MFPDCPEADNLDKFLFIELWLTRFQKLIA